MSNPFINTKQVEDLTTNEQALFRKYIGSNDEDGRMPADQFPDRLDARLAVLDEDEELLNEVPLEQGELAWASGRLRKGDGSTYGGLDYLDSMRVPNGFPLHVPGHITFVLTHESGENVAFRCTTSDGQYGVLWWDNTIDLVNSGQSASKSVDSPSESWVSAPKLVRVFPASGESLVSFNCSIPLTFLDFHGAPLQSLVIIGSEIQRLVNFSSGWKGGKIGGNPQLAYIDLSGVEELEGTFDALLGTAIGESEPGSGDGSVEILRARGMSIANGTSLDIRGNQLSALALDRFFSDLAPGTGFIIYGRNPGTADCNPSIAAGKGYQLFEEL